MNPGIAPSGLFWTIPIPSNSVRTNLGAGTASMRMNDLTVPDFGNIVNTIGALNPPIPTIDSTASFDVHWQGKGALTRLSDAANGFNGMFIDSNATIAWTAEQPSTHFQFVSADADTSTTVSAVIGFERNGRFFNG
jgi:hypothetical protein